MNSGEFKDCVQHLYARNQIDKQRPKKASSK